MKKIFISIFIFYFLSCSHPSYSQEQVCFSNHCFEVEVVKTPEAMARGLQFRESLAEQSGMLFVFLQDAKHSFWMKDTLIPLDIIWMDEALQIVDIAKNVPSCKSNPCPLYTPRAQARYVLEIKGGSSDTLNLAIGQSAVFR